MAVAFESVSTTSWEGNQVSETLVINKPSGVAVGDMLIAHIASTTTGDSVVGATYDLPSGWTHITFFVEDDVGGRGTHIQVAGKIAEAADVSASNYTFTMNQSISVWSAGAIWRISGSGSLESVQSASEGDSATSTPSFANTVTPVFADSLILFLGSFEDNTGSGSATSYAIATDNPTWTEAYDVFGDANSFFGAGAGDGLMVGAYASRPETTATGNSTLTLTSFSNYSVGSIIVIPPQTDISTSIDASGVTTLSGNNIDVYLDYTTEVGVGDITISSPNHTPSTQERSVFSNESKTSSSWVNENK